MKRISPVLLCILDGWGEGPSTEHNAITQAHTPHWDALRARYPFTTLEASEHHVGLPAGQMGNSEVGHMNIGAGRVVMQDLPRIDAAIADGTLAENPELVRFIHALRRSGGACHLMGLLSDGGVHAQLSHLIALLKLLADAGIPVAIHGFTDGRDVSPKSAQSYLAALEEAMPENCGIATLSGRYYAMDRDHRWTRIESAYNAIVSASGPKMPDAATAIEASYAAGVTDEFIVPTVMEWYDGMAEGDGICMVNFRADRARQLLSALLDPQFSHFLRRDIITSLHALGMAHYSTALDPSIRTLFAPQTIANGLGEMASKAGLTQLRIAETEKYAHVTFFFNGGREEAFAGESRILIPSPNVATYDLQPEMSAVALTDALVDAIHSQTLDLIVVNFANTDMVGHSGNLAATIAAVEAVDACLGRIAHAIHATHGAMLITADHGNAECLHDAGHDQPHTAHTLNPVPCLFVGAGFEGMAPPPTPGVLADIAPTLCHMLGIAQPPEMTGRVLIALAQSASTHARA